MRKDLLIEIEEPMFDLVCDVAAIYVSFDTNRAEQAARLVRLSQDYVAIGLTPIKVGVFQLALNDPIAEKFYDMIDQAKAIDVTGLSLVDAEGNDRIKYLAGRYAVTVIEKAYCIEVTTEDYDSGCYYRSEEVMVLDSIPTWNVLFKTDQPQPDENIYEAAAEEMDDDD